MAGHSHQSGKPLHSALEQCTVRQKGPNIVLSQNSICFFVFGLFKVEGDRLGET